MDATGKAHVVEMDKLDRFKDDGEPGSIADVIKSRMRERIESWEFIPPMRHGVAVPGKTHVYISLEAYDGNTGGMAIRILNAVTGGRISEVHMGELIKAMMISGESGRVSIDVAWRNDGSVDSLEVADNSTQERNRHAQTIGPKLLKAALKIAQTWRFEPEIVEGMPIPGKGRVPIAFCLDGKCPGEEKSETTIQEPQFAALDPAIGLRTAVAGTAL